MFSNPYLANYLYTSFSSQTCDKQEHQTKAYRNIIIKKNKRESAKNISTSSRINKKFGKFSFLCVFVFYAWIKDLTWSTRKDIFIICMATFFKQKLTRHHIQKKNEKFYFYLISCRLWDFSCSINNKKNFFLKKKIN